LVPGGAAIVAKVQCVERQSSHLGAAAERLLPDRALPATLDKGPHQRVDLDVFFGAPGRVGVEVQVLPQAATRYA
jgi:hypothetical protein